MAQHFNVMTDNIRERELLIRENEIKLSALNETLEEQVLIRTKHW